MLFFPIAASFISIVFSVDGGIGSSSSIIIIIIIIIIITTTTTTLPSVYRKGKKLKEAAIRLESTAIWSSRSGMTRSGPKVSKSAAMKKKKRKKKMACG
jgi:hypothetical protein